MEGREQKHQSIKKYSMNTTYQSKWSLIFRHEFIQLIYLRENGYDDTNYVKRRKSYLPDDVENVCTTCGYLSDNNECFFCDGVFVNKILKQIKKH